MADVALTCPTCSEPFTRRRAEVNRQRRTRPDYKFYCSRACAGRSPANLEHFQRVGLANLGFSAEAVAKAAAANTKYTPWDRFCVTMTRRAAKRSHACTITPLDVRAKLDAQRYICALTNIPLCLDAPRLLYPSLDRIDSAVGYLPGNIQIVVMAANHAKGVATDSEFAEFIGAILRNSR